MNIELLKACGVDYEDGLDRFSGNSALYEKYLNKLLNDTMYEKMKELLNEGDIQGAFEAAHKLKAFIGNLSINHFYEELKSLTEELRAGIKRDYEPDLAQLDLEYDKIISAIRGNDNV